MSEALEETRCLPRVDHRLWRRQIALAALGVSRDDWPKGNPSRFFSGIVRGHWHVIDAFRQEGRQITIWGRTSPSQRSKRRLSAREVQVAKRVAHGEPNKVIAAELGISETTVSTHLHAVVGKLGLLNRSMLVASIPAHAFDIPPAHFGAPPLDLEQASQQVTTEVVPIRFEGRALAVLGITVQSEKTSIRLTASEQSVATLVAAGLSYKAIADARGASPNTIKNQASAIYRKLGVNSRFELTALWFGTSRSVHSGWSRTSAGTGTAPRPQGQ